MAADATKLAGQAADEPKEPVHSADQDAVVLPPLRADLIITQQMYEGRTYYVIKDPVSMQYFRLTAEDFFLATLFDGKRSFGAAREEWLARFPHLRMENSPEDIKERLLRFSNDLALLQFLAVQGVRLKARYDAAKERKQKKAGFYNFVNKLFFSRFSLYDPDVLFGKMAKPLWWMWTKTTLWISMAIIVSAVVVFILNADRIQPVMLHFFSLHNIALLWVTTILIKSIHEFGHGLTCKHYGGEVHEVGVMILIFTPYFFVNVTDSWVMPKRSHRIWVSAAGIYVELILAAFATFAWALSQPGFIEQLLYNVIIIASISTIFFNANPLMRFDGYYIMTDLLEVPNLQSKSRALITQQVKRGLFGKNYEDQSMARLPLPKKRFWLFYVYAVASWLYGYYVIYNLAIFMAPHLEPYGLEGLADWFSAMALIAWVLMPIIGFVKSLQLTREDVCSGGRLRRIMKYGGIAAVLFAGFCAWPWSLEIRRSIAVTLAEPDTIRAQVSGFVVEALVKEGEVLQPGAEIVRLENREVTASLASLRERRKAAEAQVQRALGLEKPGELREAEAMLAQMNASLAHAQMEADQLVVRTKTGGTMLTRELSLRRGRLVKQGELIAEVAPLDVILIKVPLNEHQVRYVRKGQEVELKAAAYPGRVMKGVIAGEPLMFISQSMPAAYSEARTGDVATGMDREGKEVPLKRTYEATIEVDNQDGLLRPGMSGRAKIYAGRHRFGKLFWQSLLDLIRLDLRF